MNNTVWNKRIPTILGLFIIVIGIGLTTFLVEKGAIFTSLAGPSNSPKNVRITNIQDTSFTVSFTTDANVLGSVNFGKDKNLGSSALDDRDTQKNSLSPHTVHSITVKNLTPQTSYYFSITSGQETFLQNEIPFTVKTGPNIKLPPISQGKIVGKVLLSSGNLSKETIVYLTSENAQIISALTKEDGSYEIPLNFLRTKDLSSYLSLQSNSVIKMLAASENLSSNVQLSVGQTSSVPPIILSNDYDFTISPQPLASESAKIFSSLPIPSSVPTGKNLEILASQKNQGFSDQQPKFSGIALPNSSVSITIHSPENIQTQVTTDKFGNWTYRPPTPLSPGAHTISVVAKDISGILRTITQSFVIYASGTQVTESATPSATPVVSPLPTLTVTLTPIPTLILTPTPTIAPTIPPISSISPTILPKKTAPPGNPNIVSIGITGIVITAFGIFLFLLTRGGILSL
ncbi:Ig-like domain-containing protein [Patescibacteria group bacterium]|nr:Ig-like domain-containing protein [Patescibacteria group bacterium]